jgi:hypothetical protein
MTARAPDGCGWPQTCVAAIILGLALACTMPSPSAAVTSPPQAKGTPAKPHAKTGAHVGAPSHKRTRLKFRGSRTAAAREAAQLGALVGNGCNGRADMPRNEHQWVVLCSNGKTYVVETPSPQRTAAPAVECSLAGAGPQPACFEE